MRIAVLAFVFGAVAAPVWANSFDKADLNMDGAVSQMEFERTQGFERQRFFHRADLDNDRSLTKEEFKGSERLYRRARGRGDE